jgi:hypothetical protein
MIVGMSTSTFTTLHVVISLTGIVSGAVVLFGMLSDRRLEGWTVLFLATTVLTSVTGFLFHSASFGPPQVVGGMSLVILTITIAALYVFRLAAFWRLAYILGAVTALYLNAFVGVVQAFQKLSLLQPLAPTQSEPPFLVSQLVVLAIFVALGVGAVKRFHPSMSAPT